jgi:hypothetical protein
VSLLFFSVTEIYIWSFIMTNVVNEATLNEKFTSEEVQKAKKKAINTLVGLLNSPQGQIQLDAAKLLLDYTFRA